MRQENISLRQNELKGALIDYDVNEITHDQVEETYENDELQKIIYRYLSLQVLKYLPRSAEQRKELDDMFKERVLGIKIKGENDHSHDEDEYCSDSNNSKQYNDNLSDSQYDNRD